ncbi:RNA polymerase sigma factor [Streptomyces olivaceiscleroticus]|uniref:RNA polymerase sigma factor 70 region 4 type 2 domain-containing protein n=1 Tax=Streptomyces olivaceiscleroticus TaxID=68245 RepID=A0ABN1B204_9ACTN
MGFTTRKAQEIRKVGKSRQAPRTRTTPRPRRVPRTAEAGPPPDAAHTDARSGPPSPTAAFDALYDRHAPSLARQAFLLTGRTRLSAEAVERAFQLAWQCWPEVAKDHDPAGWVRAAAHEYALSPWHRFRPSSFRSPARAAGSGRPDPLLTALLRLPAPYRRALLLHDAVGLGLAETAAEVEASTPAAAGRLAHARQVLAGHLPELGLDGASPAGQRAILCERLAGLTAAHPVRMPAARAVRTGGERSTRRRTRGAIGLTGLIVALTVTTLWTGGGERYVPPPGRPGVPAAGDPQAEHGPGHHR